MIAISVPHTSRQTWIIGGITAAIVLGVAGYFAGRAFVFTPQTATPPPTPAHTAGPVVPPEPPATKPSPLTGLPVAPELADRPIRGVMIENSPDARPQSGLSQAGVVFEAVAEGGITRFLTLFLDTTPASLGPVRSLRPYYLDWAMEFNAPVAHAGGSADALNAVATLQAKALNALAIGAPTFYRTSDRRAPHNLYTSTALLDALLQKRGYFTPPAFTPTPRQADAPSPAPTATNITINYSSSLYTASYHYDAAKNSYARLLAGKPHIDRNTGAQIGVKNIVVMYMPTTYDNVGHAIMPTIGSGKAIVFRDGIALTATWSRTSRAARTQLLDAGGREIPLNAGNTWYSIVPLGRTVTY